MVTSKDKYWVIGGAYTGTDFKTLAPGTELEEYGPFDTEEEAHEKWNGVSMNHIDECYTRYEIQVEFQIECTREQEELFRASAKNLNMTLNEFFDHALREHIKNHPLTREDFKEISE